MSDDSEERVSFVLSAVFAATAGIGFRRRRVTSGAFMLPRHDHIGDNLDRPCNYRVDLLQSLGVRARVPKSRVSKRPGHRRMENIGLSLEYNYYYSAPFTPGLIV